MADEEHRHAVEIEPAVLEEEMVRVSSDMAYWSQRYAEIYGYWRQCQEATKIVAASRRRQLRMDWEMESAVAETKMRRPTVQDVEDELQLDEHYQQARAKEHTAEAEKYRIRGIVDAIGVKHSMLIQLGADRRVEMEMAEGIRVRSRSIDREIEDNEREQNPR